VKIEWTVKITADPGSDVEEAVVSSVVSSTVDCVRKGDGIARVLASSLIGGIEMEVFPVLGVKPLYQQVIERLESDRG
jgi:hypothetical protein